MESYIGILAALGFGIALSGGFMALSWFVSWMQGQNQPDPIKYTTYECGIPPKANARQRYTVGFYMIALAFLIFDVETALLYPWAHSFQSLAREIGSPILYSMLTFTALLVVALAYIWKEGIFDWPARARTQGRKVQ